MESTNTIDRIKTLNNMGNMVLRPEPALNAYLEHVERTQGKFADIGTAYGNSTLEALKRGGRIKAFDLDQRHLDILIDKCPPTHKSSLTVECGHFPNTINLSSNAYDGVLLSRVLIFLTHSEITLAFSKIYDGLKEGGIVYITSPSPFRKKWEALNPIYEKQKLENSPWPGRIDNLWSLIPEEKVRLPNTIQLIDSPSLHHGLLQAGFKVNRCEYYPTTNASSEEVFELTYAIASKSL